MKSQSKYALISAILVAIFGIGFLGYSVLASYTGNAVTLSTLLSGENTSSNRMMTEVANSGFTTSTAVGTQNAVTSGAGWIHSVTVTTPAATGIFKIYDALTVTGTPIATITTTTSSTPFTLTLDRTYSIGLSIQASGQAQEVSISYHQY